MEEFSDSDVEADIPGASPGIGEEIRSAQNSDLWGFVVGAGLLVVIMVVGFFVYKKRRADKHSRRPLNEKREYLISERLYLTERKETDFHQCIMIRSDTTTENTFESSKRTECLK